MVDVLHCMDLGITAHAVAKIRRRGPRLVPTERREVQTPRKADAGTPAQQQWLPEAQSEGSGDSAHGILHLGTGRSALSRPFWSPCTCSSINGAPSDWDLGIKPRGHLPDWPNKVAALGTARRVSGDLTNVANKKPQTDTPNTLQTPPRTSTAYTAHEQKPDQKHTRKHRDIATTNSPQTWACPVLHRLQSTARKNTQHTTLS